MSLEAARDLSILDLLRVLTEKLGLESFRLREACLLLTTASLEAEVSTPLICPPDGREAALLTLNL